MNFDKFLEKMSKNLDSDSKLNEAVKSNEQRTFDLLTLYLKGSKFNFQNSAWSYDKLSGEASFDDINYPNVKDKRIMKRNFAHRTKQEALDKIKELKASGLNYFFFTYDDDERGYLTYIYWAASKEFNNIIDVLYQLMLSTQENGFREGADGATKKENKFLKRVGSTNNYDDD